jgi:hypothetical protein
MKPILITLLFIPPILFVVAIVYLWWRRASVVATTRRRVLSWIFAANLVLGPLGAWYWLSTARSDFDVLLLLCFGVCWACAVVEGVRQLRNEYKHTIDHS